MFPSRFLVVLFPRRAWWVWLALLTSPVFAQAPLALPDASGKAHDADAEWAALKELGRRQPPGPAGNSEAARAAARTQAIATALADADKLKAFYTKNADHAQAKAAKRDEAVLLLRAYQWGDTTQNARRRQLVTEIRRDSAQPLQERANLAALADHLDVAVQKNLSPQGRLDAYEQALRGLIAEFPTVPDGYEALAHLAEDNTDAKAQALARELLALPASAVVKAHAQALLDRHALVGKPLADLLAPALRKEDWVARLKDRTVVLYAWATFSPRSIEQAKKLAAQAPKDAVILGICLDEHRLDPAKALAAKEKLPGEQIFDWLGRRGEAAEALRLTEPGLVYLADATGTLRSVSAQRDLGAVLGTLTKL